MVERRYRDVWMLVVALLFATLAFAAGADAVVGGQPDNQEHPSVGVVFGLDSEGHSIFFCTGTLVMPTAVLTAAHCFDNEFGNPASIIVDFDQQLRQVVTPSGTFYVIDHFVAGTPDPDLLYDPSIVSTQGKGGTAAFIANSAYDIGLLHLTQPAADVFPGIQPVSIVAGGAAPSKKAELLQVGYGEQRSGPPGQGSSYFVDFTRNQSVMPVTKLSDGILFLNGNSVNAVGFGGICAGDSGSPVFSSTGAVLAVFSFGSSNCQNVAGAVRVDAGPGRAFLRSRGLVP